jgi:hypothetical protein
VIIPSPITPNFLEALDILLGFHISRSPSGEIEVKENVIAADADPEIRRRYRLAWQILAEGRATAMP